MRSFGEPAGTLRIDESVSHLGYGELDWNEPKFGMGLRVLPLAARARKLLSERRRTALEEWMTSGRSGGREDFGRSLVFPRAGDKERPYGRHALLWRWQRLQDRAGLKRVHLYALRHTAPMFLGRSGTSRRNRGSWDRPTPGRR